MKIPEQYLPVMPCLILSDTQGFLQFAKDVFDATEQLIVASEDNRIRHGEIRIGDAIVMFGEAGNWREKTSAMYLHVDDVNNVYDKAIRQGAKSLEAPQQKEYGYTAGFEDPYGNQWFIVAGE